MTDDQRRVIIDMDFANTVVNTADRWALTRTHQDFYDRIITEVRRNASFYGAISSNPIYRHAEASAVKPRRHVLKNVSVPTCGLSDFLSSLRRSGMTGNMWLNIRVFVGSYELVVRPTKSTPEVRLSDEHGRLVSPSIIHGYNVTSVLWYREGTSYYIGISSSFNATDMYYVRSGGSRRYPEVPTSRAFFDVRRRDKLLRIRTENIDLGSALHLAEEAKRENRLRLREGLGLGGRGANRWR